MLKNCANAFSKRSKNIDLQQIKPVFLAKKYLEHELYLFNPSERNP